MTTINQTRITITALKVADFASEETLCFQANVLLDGRLIATAHNDGHGGMTHVMPAARQAVDLQTSRELLEQAKAYAKSLPNLVTDWDDESHPGSKITLPVTLDLIVDLLAAEQHATRPRRRSRTTRQLHA